MEKGLAGKVAAVVGDVCLGVEAQVNSRET